MIFRLKAEATGLGGWRLGFPDLQPLASDLLLYGLAQRPRHLADRPVLEADEGPDHVVAWGERAERHGGRCGDARFIDTRERHWQRRERRAIGGTRDLECRPQPRRRRAAVDVERGDRAWFGGEFEKCRAC